MRARLLLATVVTVVATVLLTPAAAHAKGADQATIEGDDLAAPIVVSGNEGDSGQLHLLTDLTGLFPASFEQTPDPMLAAEPPGDHGPRYTITWRIPAGDGTAQTVVQDVYPFTAGGGLTYMAPGQTFMGTDTTRGGWYRSTSTLEVVLVHLGIPDHATVGTVPATLASTVPSTVPAATAAPAPAPTIEPSGHGWLSGTALVVLVALLAAGAAGTAGLAARRRGRVAPT
jgi:hypothetical protein